VILQKGTHRIEQKIISFQEFYVICTPTLLLFGDCAQEDLPNCQYKCLLRRSRETSDVGLAPQGKPREQNEPGH